MNDLVLGLVLTCAIAACIALALNDAETHIVDMPSWEGDGWEITKDDIPPEAPPADSPPGQQRDQKDTPE